MSLIQISLILNSLEYFSFRPPRPILQHFPLPRHSYHNTAPIRAYWLLENPLLNILYKDRRANNIDTGFELIEFAGSIFVPNPQNYKSSSNADKQREAFNTKILTLIANGT